MRLRISTLLAFTVVALAVLLASPARAAVVCDAASMMADAASAGFASTNGDAIAVDDRSCNGAHHDGDDDIVIGDVGALCDARGASAIAQERVHGISDARIDAAPGCNVLVDGPSATVGTRTHAPPPLATPAILDQAIISSTSLVIPAAHATLLSYAPVEGDARPQFQRRVDRPPR